MRRPCIDCGAITNGQTRCPEHTRAFQARRDRLRGTSAQRGYGPAWQRIRRRVLERDDYVCQLCGGEGATSVDHVIAKRDGGTDELANLRAAHVSCNSAARPDPRPFP